MRHPIAFLAAVLLAGAPGALYAAGAAQAGPTRSFATEVPATGLARVKLVVGVGSVDVKAGPVDAVKVTVTALPGNHGHFIFNWSTGTSAGAIPADLHLVTEREGKTLVIRLAGADGSSSGHAIVIGPFGTESGNNGWKGDWTVVLPARLALALEGGVGSFRIRGVAGGVNAKIGVGSLDATLPNGPATIDNGVGRVKLDVASAAYGTVDLTAGVGDVAFTVNGRTNRTGYEHRFVASTQQVTGSGHTNYTLKVGTGHVVLNLGVNGAAAVARAAGGGSGR